MTDYAEFRLRIERGPRQGTYRVEASGLGGESPGRFKVPFSDTELENFVLKVGRTRRGVRRIESPEMQAARAFGEQLFSAVMEGKTGELYRAAQSEARATGQGLRITLSLTDVPELGAIPWEFLYDPPNFLSISTWTPVVRYLDLPKPRRPLKLELPLRILGVVSSPVGEELLNGDLERAKLEDALKPLRDANAVTIDWLEEATLLALTKKVRTDSYHIIHFIGHGGFDASSGEGALLFEDSTGHSRIVSGDQLGTVLHDKIALRLVVLNSCEGARNSLSDPFSGVATKLVQREVPAVIGMQFEITDRAAVLFASEFYAMLAEGKPVDSALAEARLAIFADQNDVEWGTPVLFMRVGDGRLFEIAHASALPRVDPQTLPPPVADDRSDEPEPEPEPEPEQPAPEPISEPEPEAPEPEPEAPEPEPGPELEPEQLAPAPVSELEPEQLAPAPTPEPEPEPPVIEPVTLAGPPADVLPPTRPPEDAAPISTPRSAATVGPDIRAAVDAPPSGPRPVILPPEAPPTAPEPKWEPQPQPKAEDATKEQAAPKDKWVTPPRRRIPWVKIAIAAVIVVAVLAVIGLMVPPEETGSVAVNPAGVWDTDLVSVSGSGFTPGEKVDVFLDGSFFDTVTADSAGAFSGMVAVHGKRQGTIKVVGRQSQNQASSLFTAPAGPATQSAGSSTEASTGPVSEPPAGPTSPGILYWSDTVPGSTVTGRRQLYGIDPATPGSVPEQLTTDDVDSAFPAWSPDYTMMAFARGAAQSRDIWYRDSQGDHQLTTAASDDWYPTWAKDGWIAYSSRTSTESSIRALRIDGGGEDHQIFSGEGVRTPAWSPNADKLAFTGALYGADNDDVMTVLADGTGLDRLTDDAAADRNPTWSPSGNTIAFVHNEGNTGNDKDNEIYLLDVATKVATRLTTNGVQDGNPVWSSDGSQIAVFRKSEDGFHIWVINIDGSHEGDLMPNAHGLNQDPNWR